MAIKKKKRKEKIEAALNYRVEGEAFIITTPRQWKTIIFTNFNQIKRRKMTIVQVLDLLKTKDVQFGQKDSLVEYPVKEYISYIAKISGQEIDL